MSAARGYGLALAFFFWAMFHMLVYRVERREASIAKAAIGLALSVASNLTFAFPGAALGMIFTFWLTRERQTHAWIRVPPIRTSTTILRYPPMLPSSNNFRC